MAYSRCLFHAIASKKHLPKYEFKALYGKLKKNETQELYLLILRELEKSLLDDNCGTFDAMSEAKVYVHEIESAEVLKDYIKSDENPFSKCNLVIMACKHNKLKILKHMHKHKILNSLSYGTGREVVAINDQDETCHNAFYYAIRSDNVELLEALIGLWSGSYFNISSDDLEDILCTSYKELKLRRVPFSFDMEAYVISKIVELRFRPNASQTQESVNKVAATQTRIDIVLEKIKLLSSEYSDVDKYIDDRFLYISKIIAFNIHVLKRRLGFSYDTLPWEEMEFCLCVIVLSYTKKSEINLYNFQYLSKEKIIFHLEKFSNKLEEKSEEIISRLESILERKDFKKLYSKPKLRREVVVDSIIKSYPEFKELYSDYTELRDIHSLHRIHTYISLASSINPEEKEGQIILMRAIQVIGEHLKNTLESPKLSTTTSELLLLSLPKSTGQILTDLRNSLSHSESLEKRIEIEKKADVSLFKGIQTDLEQIGRDISTTFIMKKMKAVHTVLKKIISCTNIHEMRQALLATDYIDTHEIKAAAAEETEKRLKLLVQTFRDSFNVKTEYERKLLDRIDQLTINCSKGNENYYRGVLHLKNESDRCDSTKINDKQFKAIIRESEFILHDLSMETINKNYQDIYILLKQIYNSVCRRLQTDQLNKIILELCKFAEIAFCNFKWIEELREMLSKNIYKSESEKIILSKEELKKELDLKILELDKHFNNNVRCYMENKNAQTVTDMLVLDILSISDRLSKENDQKRQYKDDTFLLDQDVPLITGQSLRNHLAHCNTVFDLLITDPKISVFVNAKRLISENAIFASYQDKSSILKNIYDKDLNIIINQQNMLSSLEKGNSFKKLVSKGADLNGRGLNSWTSLHFASQGPSLKAVKYIIKNSNIPINCKNDDGELPLHIAVKHGMKPIVEFYIKEKYIPVNSVDNWLRTPLHFAAIRGHCEIVSVLLELKPDVAVRDTYANSCLFYAITNDHLDVVKLLLESNIYEDIESLITPFTCVFLAAEMGSLNILNYLLENQHKINDRTELGRSPLHIASAAGHFDVVNLLISNGAEINAQNIEGLTPLHFSAANGHETITDVLVKNGADLNAFIKISKRTPLHLAIRHGNENVVKLLLEKGANANALTKQGESPLCVAARSGHIEIVDLLLNFDTDIDFQNEFITTALHGAAMNGHDKIVDLLIKHNAKVDARQKGFGLTTLHIATLNNHTNVINLLLKKGAEINALSSKKSAPLHIASSIIILDRNKYMISETVLLSHTEVKQFQAEDCAEERTILVEVLLKNKAEVNLKDIHGRTPLHLASSFGYEGIVNALINYKADINPKDLNNLTPLHYAVKGNHKSCVESLLKNGADISDSSPLMFAVNNNNEDIVQVLISDRRQTMYIDTALKFAVSRGYRNIVDILLKKTSRNTDIFSEYSLLHVAANSGHNSVVKLLVEYGANVNMVWTDGTSPLYLAAKEGHQRTVEILLNYKAITDIKSDGVTPLHIASCLGHNEIAKLLINHGSSVNIKDSKNKTSLQIAVDHGHIDVVKTLIETGGADIHVKDNNGYTLLHVASEKNTIDIVKYLVSKGCDVHVKEDSGLKAIHIAAREGSVTAVQFFLDSGFSINDTDKDGRTLLHHAVIRGRPEMVNFLIKQGIDINAKDNKGQTPLHIAVTFSHKDIIEMLLTSGAYYDILDDTYKRPSDLCKTEDFKLFHSIQKLFEAVEQNNLPGVENCIKAGAIVNSKNTQNLAPLHLASRNGNTEIVNILLKNKCDSNILGEKKFTPLHYACCIGNLSVVKALLCHKAKYNVPNKKGKIPLQLAADKSIVNLLTTVEETFQMIELNDPQVLNKLKMLKKNDSLKAALNARNKENKSLAEIAFCKNFEKMIKKLEIIVQELDGQVLIDKAERDLELGEYSSAIFNFKCVLEKRNEFLGPSNPFTLDIKAKIADCLHEQGMYNDALKLREKICRIRSEIFGEDNKYTLDIKSGIASTLGLLCKNEEALNIFNEIYLKQNQMLGSDHEDTLRAQMNRAIILTKLKKYDESLLQCRKIYEKTKINSPEIALSAQSKIGEILSKQGKLDEALKEHKDVYNKFQSRFGTNHPQTLSASEDISYILGKQNRYFEACNRLEHVFSIRKKILGPFHPRTLTTQTNIAKLYYHQRKFVSSFKSFNEIIELSKESLGNTNRILEDIQWIMHQIRYELKRDGLEESDLLECLKPDIIIASQESDIRKVKEILEKGANINEGDIQGRTPLHLAVANNARDLVKFLLENEADVTQVTIKGETPLHIAAARGRKDIAEMLLNHAFHHKLKNPLNFQKTFRRNSAIHVAARKGDFQLVLLLLKFGAIYNLINDEGNSPLDISVDERICKLLMLIKELFENAKTGNVKLIELIKNLKEEEVQAVTGACNRLEYTLLRVLLENKHQKVAQNLSEIINIDSI